MNTLQELQDRAHAALRKARDITDAVERAGRKSYTDSEATEINALLDSARKDTEEVKARRAARKSADELGRLLDSDRDDFDDSPPMGGTGTKGHRSFDRMAARFADTAIKELQSAGGRVKAVTVTAQGSFTAGTPYVPGTEDDVIGPDPRLGVLGLVHDEQISRDTGGNYSFLQESLHTNAAAIVPDLARKPQSTYELKEVTDKIKVLAHLSKPLPNRYLEDYAAFRNYLRTTMSRDLYRVLNTELLAGDGTAEHLAGVLNSTGVQQQAWTTNLPTTLRKARTRLAAIDEQPTAWLVSATDAEAIDLFADNQSRFQSLNEILGKLPVVPSTALPAGTAILADWRLAKLMTFRDDGIRLQVTDSLPFVSGVAADGQDIISGNLFDHNMFALRAEMRVGGLAISRPGAFVVVDLSV